jgi:hypothetical protein
MPASIWAALLQSSSFSRISARFSRIIVTESSKLTTRGCIRSSVLRTCAPACLVGCMGGLVAGSGGVETYYVATSLCRSAGTALRSWENDCNSGLLMTSGTSSLSTAPQTPHQRRLPGARSADGDGRTVVNERLERGGCVARH